MLNPLRKLIECGAALMLLTLAGCAVDMVSPLDPHTAIPDRSQDLLARQRGRSEVRVELGPALFSSSYWGFDLFRAETEQADTVVAVTPWPVPFARIKDKLQRYTLVAYDGNGRASAVASGIFRRPVAWRNVSPIKSDFPALHLRAGELMFFVDPEGARQENLLIAPSGRDAFLQRAAKADTCLVVLGCGTRGCGDQLSIDAGPVRRLPLRTAHGYWLKDGERDAWRQGIEAPDDLQRMPWTEALVALSLQPGEHELEFSARYLDGRHAEKFYCRAHDVGYWTLDAEEGGNSLKRSLIHWRIEQESSLPASFSRRPLVLLEDGQWYAEVEPFQ